MLLNKGWVSVGIDHDTAEFAVNSIRSWWKKMGRRAYRSATELLITADAGGSNGYRTRLWKLALQDLADETGLRLKVCHFPLGTSKWNKIEHRSCRNRHDLCNAGHPIMPRRLWGRGTCDRQRQNPLFPARHNQRLLRKANTASSGLKRRELSVLGFVFARAFSFSCMLA
jgi:hypothetical protein